MAGIEPLESRMLLAGNGLVAVYFDNVDLSGTSVARTDATVNFNLAEARPTRGLAGTTFSAGWTGQVQANSSKAYTFSPDSDDGVRLWVKGSLLITQWNRHAAREDK